MHNKLKFPKSVLHVRMRTDRLHPNQSKGKMQDNSFALFIAESVIDMPKVFLIVKKYQMTLKVRQKLVPLLF